MALFLAALRGIDGEIVKAARIDGAPVWKIYAFILIPMLRPAFLTVIVLLAVAVLRNFDLVVVLTGGGPGYASDLPSRFMYEMAFRRDQLGLGAASAIMMLFTFIAIIVPYIYSELRLRRCQAEPHTSSTLILPSHSLFFPSSRPSFSTMSTA